MAKNITAGGAQVVASGAKGINITVNTALTGTIIVTTAGSTQYNTPAATIATITNPIAGNSFTYSGMRQWGAISVNPSGVCDITVNILNRIF